MSRGICRRSGRQAGREETISDEKLNVPQACHENMWLETPTDAKELEISGQRWSRVQLNTPPNLAEMGLLH
jgi:hypothetical protein